MAASLPIDPLVQAREWRDAASSCIKRAAQLTLMAERLEAACLIPNSVLDAVASAWGLQRTQLVSHNRRYRIATARHVVGYLLVERFNYSTLKAGRVINRHHTTVMHGCDVVRRRMMNRDFAKLVDHIEETARAAGHLAAMETPIAGVFGHPASIGSVEGMEAGK